MKTELVGSLLAKNYKYLSPRHFYDHKISESGTCHLLEPGNYEYQDRVRDPLLKTHEISNNTGFLTVKDSVQKRLAFLKKKKEVEEAILEKEKALNTSELSAQSGQINKSTIDYINDLPSEYNPFDDIGTD